MSIQGDIARDSTKSAVLEMVDEAIQRLMQKDKEVLDELLALKKKVEGIR